jgi:cbb3-type cytochrome oxidase maturation protein
VNVLYFLIPITFCLGLVGLAAFIWNLRNGQYEDLSGAAERVLTDEPAPPNRASHRGSAASAPPRANEDEATWSQI